MNYTYDHIYIIWSDYDGINVEEFSNVKEAEARLLELYSLEKSSDSNGTEIKDIISGVRVSYAVGVTAIIFNDEMPKEVASAISIIHA